MAFIKAKCTLPRSESYKLFQEKFNRNDVSFNNFTGLCKRKGWLTGRDGCFKKGHDGYKGGPGGPNKTSFKKGNIPANTKPLYTERTSKDGYIEIKVPEINPYTGAKTRYRFKHQVVWEQHNGPVPKGHILHFIDGDRTNCNIDNLEVISRGVGAIMNKMQHSSMPDEIKPVVKTLAKLKHKQHKLNRENG
ncbi:MAG: HNH endonuclease [Gammaproteobacteria bacterium]|nr:HNH endonuclease [Gammaproteobacteria bacterium]